MDMTELLLALLLIAISAVAYFTKRIMDDTKGLRAEMKPITPAIVEIQGKFKDQGHSILFPLTVTPGSPLKLTEYGQRLMKESGFDKIIDNENNKKTLVDVVKAMNPQTNYDLQECSIRTIQELLDKNNPMLNPLKEYAFNNGLPLEVIVQPAGVVLRDEVLKVVKL